jgi:hypothetical protein
MLTARVLGWIILKLFGHLLEIAAHSLKIRRENSKWVIGLRSQQEYCDLLASRTSEVAIQIWKLDRRLFRWDSLKIGIWYDPISDEDSVDEPDQEKCYCWCDGIEF